MLELVAHTPRIRAMSQPAIDRVRVLETICAKLPQASIETLHVIHAGMYARTVQIPAGVLITGTLIKRATLLILHGDAVVYLDGEAVEVHGYNVVPADANRKQAFLALTETSLTMIFPSSARSIEEAEAEFTDELELLASRKDIALNRIVITEDEKCQA